MAYSNLGYLNLPAGTGTDTITWASTPAHNISVVVFTNNIALTLLPDRDDEGTPFTIKAGSTLTMGELELSGFSIVRASTAEVDVYWW